MTVQQAINDYTKANSITKDAFAERVGIRRSAFFMKQRGESEFTLSEAYRISREIGCTLDDFYAMTQAV